jgi:hypothetical protein
MRRWRSGNRSTQRKPPTCCKSLTNFISGMKTKLNVNFITTGRQNIVHCRVTYAWYAEYHTVYVLEWLVEVHFNRSIFTSLNIISRFQSKQTYVYIWQPTPCIVSKVISRWKKCHICLQTCDNGAL